jgi:hypothetical protein
MNALGKGGDYNVCSCHCTVYPVQLPPLLQPSIIKEVMKEFELRVSKELLSVIGKSSSTSHRRMASFQSFTNLDDNNKAKKSEDNERSLWNPHC